MHPKSLKERVERSEYVVDVSAVAEAIVSRILARIAASGDERSGDVLEAG